MQAVAALGSTRSARSASPIPAFGYSYPSDRCRFPWAGSIGMVTSSRQTIREVAAMRRIRIQKPQPIRRELEVLPLDARDPDVVRAKALIRARSCARGASLACPVATPLHRERVEEPSFAGSLRS